MSGELLLINPRRRKRTKSRRKRTSIRRRARHASRRRVHRNPRHYSRRRIRRNPLISVGGIKSALIPAGIGALGAVGLDIAFGYAGKYLPASIAQNPYLTAGAKAVGAFGLGWVASKAGIGRDKTKVAIAGALTVIAYGLVRDMVQKAAPTLPGLSGFGAYMPQLSGFGAYLPTSLPAPNLSGYNPAPYLNGVGEYGPGYADSMF